MSSPAALLQMKHAQAASESLPESTQTAPQVDEAPVSSPTEESTSISAPVSADEEASSATLVDEIAQPVEPTPKKVDLNDNKLFPSLVSISSSPISWGPSSAKNASTSTWAKPSNGSFMQAVKSTSTQLTFIIDDEQQQNLAKGELFKIFAKIQANLNVKVESTYSGATKKRTFLLNGPIDNVATAKKELIRQLTKPTKITFQIPSKLRSTVIGSGGRTLKPIIESTSVRIDIARESETGDDEDTLLTEDEELFGKSLTVTIEGDIQGCSDAKAKIMDIVNENTKSLNVKVPVSEKVRPFAASEISKLTFGDDVEVTCPEGSTKVSSIIISGPREGVVEARNAIKSLLVNLDNEVVVEERDIPKHLHQFLNSDKVFEASNVVVEIPDADEAITKVKFIGLKANISNGVAVAKQLTSEYFVDNLDLSKSHGGNYQHAKNLTAYLKYTKYFEALSSEHGVQVTAPTYKNLASSDSKSVNISFSASKDEQDIIKKARKDLVDTVNKIAPNFIRVITDIESFIFPKIDNTVAVENEVSIVPLGSLAGITNILLLVIQQNDDEFLPSAEQIQERLDNTDKSLAKVRALAQDLIAEVIETPAEDQKHLEGNTLKVLLNKYEPDTIEIKLHQNAEGASEDEIYLRGYQSEIKKAIGEIKQLIEDVKNYEEASKYNTTIDFPTQYLSRLIGQKGSHLSEIQDEFNVRIDVANDDQAKTENTDIKLTGLKSNVDECIKKVQQLAKKWADEKTVVVNVEQKYRRQLIGPNGIYANRLQDKYGVKLQFSNSEEKNGTVVIRGPSRGVAKVEEEIKQLVEYEKENGFVESVTVPVEALSRIIGKNGDNINDISVETGVQIRSKTSQEEAKKSGTAEFELTGSKAGIKEAKATITKMADRIANSTTETIDVDPKWYRNLIGPNGLTMREIIVKAGGSEDDRDFRRFIQIPHRNSDSKTIICEGDKKVVEKIIKAITKIVADLESITEDFVEIPKKQHRLIVGTGGLVRRGIEEEFKVRVNVPRQDVESDKIVVKGKPDDIAMAIAKIQALTAGKDSKKENM